MKRILVFHGSLTPYRVDFFNRIGNFSDLKVIFFYKTDPLQNFDIVGLKRQVRFSYDYILKGFNFFNRTFRFGIFKKYREIKPEILITHEFSSFSLKGLVIKKLNRKDIKWFITSDDSIGSLENLPVYRKLARKIILPHIDGLITINDDVKNWHLENYPKLNLNVFSLPILHDPIIFRNKLESSLCISKKYIDNYNLQNKKIFLFLGRLVSVKGIDRLIRVFSSIKDKNIRLVIVGDGDLKEEILTYLKFHNEDRIILTGRFDNLELFAWYNIGEIFILPSFYEPFGAVINEALLSGLFTLCSSKAGANCLIDKNYNGVLIDPLSDNSLKDNIINVIGKMSPISAERLVVKKNLMFIDYENKMKGFEYFLMQP